MNKKLLLNYLGKIAVLGIFILAIWLLYSKIQSYSLAEIRYSLRQIPNSRITFSFCLMVLNYLVLIGYDWLALKAIKKALTFSKICMVSFCGCVIGFNFGALLGGSSVRYRLYSAWGFSAMDVVRLVVMVAISFWVGAMGLAGLIFIFAPPDIPPELGMDPTWIRPLGFFLVGICSVYLAACHFARGRAITIYGKEFALPPLPIAIAQSMVAGLDLIIAASCLYVLLPADSISFLEFLPTYLLAQTATVLTHVPGGIGIIEVIIINLTPDVATQQIFASILAFRAVYYLFPLIFVAIILGGYEIFLRVSKAESQEASLWFKTWMPGIMAYAIFLAGALLCLSTVISASPQYLLLLRPHIPLLLLETAHIITGLTGVLLMVLAFGLERRKRKVWYFTVAALFAGILGNLLKGIQWPQAILLLALLFPLLSSRKIFCRTTPLLRGKYPFNWTVAILLVMGCTLILGIYFTGVPADPEILRQSGYLSARPRIWRSLFADFLLLGVLLLIYLRAVIKKRPPTEAVIEQEDSDACKDPC